MPKIFLKLEIFIRFLLLVPSLSRKIWQHKKFNFKGVSGNHQLKTFHFVWRSLIWSWRVCYNTIGGRSIGQLATVITAIDNDKSDPLVSIRPLTGWRLHSRAFSYQVGAWRFSLLLLIAVKRFHHVFVDGSELLVMW